MSVEIRDDETHMTGLRKSAILMVILGDQVSADIVKHGSNLEMAGRIDFRDYRQFLAQAVEKSTRLK